MSDSKIAKEVDEVEKELREGLDDNESVGSPRRQPSTVAEDNDDDKGTSSDTEAKPAAKKSVSSEPPSAAPGLDGGKPTPPVQQRQQQEQTVSQSTANNSYGGSGHRVFVQGLSWGTTDQTLRQFMSQFGVVLDTIIMRDKLTQRSRGFGFVSFSVKEVADSLIGRVFDLDGRRIEVKTASQRRVPQAQPGVAANSEHKAFVGSLHSAVDGAMLQREFIRFGGIKEAVVQQDRITGASRAFGFVVFNDEASLQRCLAEHATRPIAFFGQTCEVRKAFPRRTGGYRPRYQRGGFMQQQQQFPPYNVHNQPYNVQYGYQFPQQPYGYMPQQPMYHQQAQMPPQGYAPFRPSGRNNNNKYHPYR